MTTYKYPKVKSSLKEKFSQEEMREASLTEYIENHDLTKVMKKAKKEAFEEYCLLECAPMTELLRYGYKAKCFKTYQELVLELEKGGKKYIDKDKLRVKHDRTERELERCIPKFFFSKEGLNFMRVGACIFFADEMLDLDDFSKHISNIFGQVK